MKEMDDKTRYIKELIKNARREAKAAKIRKKGKESMALSPALITQYVCGDGKTGECIRHALDAWAFEYAKDKDGRIMRTCNLCLKEEEACLAAIHICTRDPPIIDHPPVIPSKVGGQKCGLCFNGPGRSHACNSRLFKRCMVDAHGHPELNTELVLRSQASSRAEVSILLDEPYKLYNQSFFMGLNNDGYIGAANVVQVPNRSKTSMCLETSNVFVGDAGQMGRGVYALKTHDQCGRWSLLYGGSIQKATTAPASETCLSKFDRQIRLRNGSKCVVNVEPLDTKCAAYLINHAHHEPNMESVDGPYGVVLVPVRTIMPGEQLLYNYMAVCDDVSEEMMCKCDMCNAGNTPDGRDRYMVVWKRRQFSC